MTGASVLDANYPDILLIQGNTSQSENSIFVNPNDETYVLNSNNSTTQPGGSINVLGANALFSNDQGNNWSGGTHGAGGSNSGDPAALISRSGRWFVGFISSSGGQGVSFSDNQGSSWTQVNIANPQGGGLLDKNHLWIDNSTSSAYQGNLYSAWTPLSTSSTSDTEIELSRSTNDGSSWSSPIAISTSVNAGSHNQGVHIQTGPNGEVYAVWAIYDSWPSDEAAIGFAASTNGGSGFQNANRIITNIRGIRNSGVGKNMRVNSYPVMAVDNSNGPNRGDIYVVWANIGAPGINTGNTSDIYMIRSSDQGNSWTTPIIVNQDNSNSNVQYLPWITCDPANGNLHVIYYDDRNTGGQEVETFVANSFDGGQTWEDFRVSDVSFTPTPIPGLAPGYFGDYLGISAKNGIVYPVWTDNRSGTALAYTSPFVVCECSESLVLINGQVSIGESQSYKARKVQVSGNSPLGGQGSFVVAGNGTQGGNVSFKAEESISFLPGFHSQLGSTMVAKIEDCENGLTNGRISLNSNNEETSKGNLELEFQSSQIEEISIYPNPVTDGVLFIDFGGYYDEALRFNVILTDLLGNHLFQKEINDKVSTVNLGNLLPTVYLLNIFKDDKRIVSTRIIIPSK